MRRGPRRSQPVRARLAIVAALLASGGLAAQAPAPLPPEGGGTVDPPRSPRNASYTIEARLDPATRTLTASATLTWRNLTSRDADDLQFHLYWNAWRDTRSTFFRELALAGPVDVPEDDFARLEITSLRLLSPEPADLTGRHRFIQPDDHNPDDQTVVAVPLPQPVPPGATATIAIAWTARVPRPFARTGVVGDFFFIAQWFPKLGVLQNDGWHTPQFHVSTEFFSDYGVYDVRLTVPQGWVVAATGVERDRRDHPGEGGAGPTTTYRYYQEDVHDFAWTTSPDYVERTARFEHPTLPAVTMRLLLQPEHVGQAERHFAATRTALKYFGEWFGAYPYGHVTIVDPAYQSRAGGMEYPTLFTAGTAWLVPAAVTYHTPEEVTVHEAGHQFFYGIVGTNEFDHAWMDEGLTTYATARALTEDYPETYFERRFFGGFVPWVFRDVRLARETFWNRLAGYRNAPKSDVPATPSYQYHPLEGLYITYSKTALWLNTMERWLGWETMQRLLSTYFARWQFRHPEPRDFFDVAAEVSDKEVGEFFDQVYRSSNVFDYGVDFLTSAKDGDDYRTDLVVRRYGEATFPIEVHVRFEDGERVVETWSGRERWKQFTYQRASRAVSAAVDPDRVLLLDVNYTNNSKTLEPRSRAAATKWALKWMVWLEDALLTWAFLV